MDGMDVQNARIATTRHRVTAAVGIAALSLTLAACTLDVRIGDAEPTTDDPLSTPGLSVGIVAFDVSGRRDTHPAGAGPLLLEDGARLREITAGAGADVLFVARYRLPAEVTDSDRTTWQVEGFSEGAWELIDPDLAGSEPVVLSTGATGSITLLVPDLAGGGYAHEVVVDAAPVTSEMYSDFRDEAPESRLYLNETAFAELVETAGGVPWAEASRTTGAGGPAEPEVIAYWGGIRSPNRPAEHEELYTLLKSSGYVLPFSLH